MLIYAVAGGMVIAWLIIYYLFGAILLSAIYNFLPFFKRLEYYLVSSILIFSAIFILALIILSQSAKGIERSEFSFFLFCATVSIIWGTLHGLIHFKVKNWFIKREERRIAIWRKKRANKVEQ